MGVRVERLVITPIKPKDRRQQAWPNPFFTPGMRARVLLLCHAALPHKLSQCMPEV